MTNTAVTDDLKDANDEAGGRVSGAADEGRTDAGTQHFDAVIVGGGPRGVATVIRVAARLRADASLPRPVRIAIVDVQEVGPGATWLTSQPAEYLNNTTASATTIYPDESTPLSGPPSPGPTLVEWMEQVARAGSHPAGDWVTAEAGRLRALDFTSRRLQGVYYRDQLDAAAADPAINLTEFTALAVDLEQADLEQAGREQTAPEKTDPGQAGLDQTTPEHTAGTTQAPDTAVVLADGRRLAAPTVVLAQGMVQAKPDAEVRRLTTFARTHGLRYVPPGMPAERDFSALPAGETVLVRGLGANFFDVVGALVAEWGGTFEEVPGDPHGRLRYLPSGREPRLVAGSRRGMPYRSKPVPYSQERPFTPRWATPEWFAELGERAGLDFAAEVWPNIAREIADQYLAALAGWAPEALREDLRPAASETAHVRAGSSTASGADVPQPGAASSGTDAPLAGAAGGNSPEAKVSAPWIPALEACRTGEDVDEVLRTAVTDPRWNWTIADLRRPTRGEQTTPEAWAAFVETLVTDELASMSEASVHPRAAVNRVMSVLRGSAQQLGAVGAVAGSSLVRDLHGWFDSDGLFLASGPPAGRVRQVLALIDAGIVDLLGPETVVTAEANSTEGGPGAGRFRALSRITGRTAESSVLLETRMSKGRVPHTDDPLLQALLTSGRARIHTVDYVQTDYLEAGPAEVSETAETGHNLVDEYAREDPSVVVLGIPASTTQPGSAIGATPHKPSPLLAGADIAAKQIVRRAVRRTVRGPAATAGAEAPEAEAGTPAAGTFAAEAGTSAAEAPAGAETPAESAV
ncbi:FAD/NAD(P)-binding protein [Brevibacterium salitolerans]|uniref:FAD/NAD(P)-binding protein n=1 Tax=Brevibacterium salitolerans TaxID=1403566 RepID=A0ABP5IN58_9MICO